MLFSWHAPAGSPLTSEAADAQRFGERKLPLCSLSLSLSEKVFPFSGARGQITDTYKSLVFLEFCRKYYLGRAQRVYHRSVLQEGDPPFWCSHSMWDESECDLRIGRKQSEFGYTLWNRISTSNGVLECQLPAKWSLWVKWRFYTAFLVGRQEKPWSQLAHYQAILGQYLDHTLNKPVCLPTNIVAYIEYQQ